VVINDIVRQSVDLLIETVLIIYDEHAVRELCKDILIPLCYIILLAENSGGNQSLSGEE